MLGYRNSFRLAILFALFAPAHALAQESYCENGRAQLRPAADYCAVFDKTGPLRGDRQVQLGKSLCTRYYEQAIATVNVFCAYVTATGPGTRTASTTAPARWYTGRRGGLRRDTCAREWSRIRRNSRTPEVIRSG